MNFYSFNQNCRVLFVFGQLVPCFHVSSMFPYFCNFYIPSVYSCTVCAVVGCHFTVLYEPRATPHPPVYLYRFESFFLFLTLPLIHALCELLPSFYNLFALCVCIHKMRVFHSEGFSLSLDLFWWSTSISNNDRLYPSSFFFGYFFPYRNLWWLLPNWCLVLCSF